MKSKRGCGIVLALFCLQLLLAAPLFAGDYDVSDISLVPGADETQLNITWHSGSGDEGDTCKVKIAKKGLFLFPSISSTFTGTTASAGVDENNDPTYSSKVVVTGLEAGTDYVYRLGDAYGNWSDSYEYTTRETDAFSFFFVADSQIGASGPKSLSASRDVKPYIAEYVIETEYEDLIDDGVLTYDGVADLVDAYSSGALADYADTYPDIDMDTLGTQIDAYYTAFSGDYAADPYHTELAALAALDATLADLLLEEIRYNLDDRKAAVEDDTTGWAATLGIMRAQFPEAAFLVSAGDQVETPDWEYEYTGFFSPQELTSLPVAPVIGSHDRAVNFGYHFNLPNETEDAANAAGGNYYFTYGNALVMVLNMDTTGQTFPKSPPPGPPPGEGGSDDEEISDRDGDGVPDEDDLCPDTYGESAFGCPLTDEYDDDGDGVTNDLDLCNNSRPEHIAAGLISAITGCPYNDVDNDGIPDEDADGNIIDRCNNTYDDLTVGDDGCADCSYLDNEAELEAMIYNLENSCDEDGNCTDNLADYKASLAEHQAFMEEAIAANPEATWKIAVWHYSCYSAGMHSTDDVMEVLRYKFTPVLEDLGVDVVLMGHDHVYTRTYQMLDNVPQTEQTVSEDGMVVNPTGVLYLTASSSSGSKFYSLNCNIGDDTSDSASYYDYAAAWYDNVRTFTLFDVEDDSLSMKTYTYVLGDTVGSYDTVLIDEYAILVDPSYQAAADGGETDSATSSKGSSSSLCFITSASSTSFQNVIFVLLALTAIAGGFRFARKMKRNR